jgi:hypothetical protein
MPQGEPNPPFQRWVALLIVAFGIFHFALSTFHFALPTLYPANAPPRFAIQTFCPAALCYPARAWNMKR